MQPTKKLLYIDLFCGAGGTSTGVDTALYDGERCAKVIACVNHDANAIASHKANHPEALHYTEDIRTLELSPLVRHTEEERKKNPGSYLVLWASLECTNFSKAKGGQPRDGDSRTLAEHLYRYVDALKPDFIQIENVEEFMCWGDLDDEGHPLSWDEGRLYTQWVKNMCAYGYHFDHRILNSADYGAYTTRKRFFGIFAKGDLPIVFPEPTHSKIGEKDLFHNLPKWRPVKDVLDFSDEGKSIFCREKPLVEATLERIYAGLIKFIAGGKDAFLLYAREKKTNGKTYFLSKYFSGEPMSKNSSVDEPAGAITTKDHHSFITIDNGNRNPPPDSKIEERPDLAFMDMQYGNGTPSDINIPAPTLTTNPKHQLVICKRPSHWVMSTNFSNVGSSIDEPAQTITANHKWHYLMNPQYKSVGGSVDKPCFTLIARMDKMPPYLIATEEGKPNTAINETDSPAMIKIKEFMQLYGIIDIKMRMLNIPELKRIMGFPDDYVLKGTLAEQKKYIGNAVEVHMAKALCEALYHTLDDYEKRKQKVA
jgi:DNA (cytosine-5)-methyltransferase 1